MFIFSVSTFLSSPFFSLSHHSNNPWVTCNNTGGSQGSQINAWKTHMKMSTKEIRGPPCTFYPNPPKDYHASIMFYTQLHHDIGEGKGSWLKASRIITVDPQKNFTLELKAVMEAAGTARATLPAGAGCSVMEALSVWFGGIYSVLETFP